jgi:hypothetical protein
MAEPPIGDERDAAYYGDSRFATRGLSSIVMQVVKISHSVRDDKSI